MIVTYLDLETGKTAKDKGISVFQLTENNWSCDCNRATPFDVTQGDDCQARRFIVIDVEEEDDKDYDWPVSFEGMSKEGIIREANEEYYLKIKLFDKNRNRHDNP